jgi:tetratricopeptide (TPR) repeat protein
MGKTQLAERSLRNSLRLNPQFTEGVYSLVGFFSEQGKFDSAFLVLESISGVETETKNIKRLKSSLYLEKGELDSASMILNHLKLDPEFRLEAYLDLGQIKYQTYQFDSALYFSGKVQQMDSLNMDGLVLAARSYDRKRFFQKALEEYERAIEIDSTNQLVREELNKLKRKVAYLRKLEKERSEVPEVVPLKRKEISN